MKDFYYILGLKPEATTDEIKRAFRKLSLKFHPDKNDGDEFFSERFKDIREAYETLCDSTKKMAYDRSRSNTQFSDFKYYNEPIIPEIHFFNSDSLIFKSGDEITFSWKTTNADRVILSPIGAVPFSGSKTYRINNSKDLTITFELIAENTGSNKVIRKSLVVRNISINLSSTESKAQNRNEPKARITLKMQQEEEKYNAKIRKITTVLIVILVLFTFFRVFQSILE